MLPLFWADTIGPVIVVGALVVFLAVGLRPEK